MALPHNETTVDLRPYTGNRFPQPTPPEVISLGITSAKTGATEIVYATARVNDRLTVLRGQEGTTPQPFEIGDFVETKVTETFLNEGGGGVAVIQSYTAPEDTTALWADLSSDTAGLLVQSSTPPEDPGVLWIDIGPTGPSSWSGTFTTVDGKTVTVIDGLITGAV